MSLHVGSALGPIKSRPRSAPAAWGGLPRARGAADKAAIQLVEVQPYQLSVSDTKRCHIPGQATNRAMRGVNGLAAQHETCAAVGAAWRSSECGGLNGDGMATAPKSGTSLQLHCEEVWCVERVRGARRPASPRKDRTDALGEHRGVGVQAPTQGLQGIMSGRTISQQGLAATCEDPPRRETESGGRVLVWRMSPLSDEDRVMLVEAVRDAARARVTPTPGEGALGTWRS